MDNQLIAQRAFFMAYNASPVMGMGFLQERSGVTEEQLCKDYGDPKHGLYADYAHGRMMKTGITWSPAGVEINRGNEPRADYQGWGRRYPTNAALLEAAMESLTKPVPAP
jgi:hypothetical protein